MEDIQLMEDISYNNGSITHLLTLMYL